MSQPLATRTACGAFVLNPIAWLRAACVVLALAGGSAFALDRMQPLSELSVTPWTMDDGLPHNFVQAIARDRDGYLWIGSWAGVARFNGREFTLFDEHTLPGVPLVGVRTILRDRDDALLFGTAQHGVVRYADGVWSRLDETAARVLRVVSLARMADASLWIGTDRTVWRLDTATGLVDLGAHGLPRGTVFALLDLGDAGMLVGSEHGLWRLRGERFERIGDARGIPAMPVRALLARRDGSVAVAGAAGVFILPGEGRARRIFAHQAESLLEDRDGALWFGASAGGLVRHAGARQEHIGEAQGLMGRASHALLEDREGLLWFGTTNGLYRINDAPAFGLDVRRGLGDNYPRTILRDADDMMYVGHARGLDRWNGTRFEAVPLAGAEASVLALGRRRAGGLWLGTYDRGVMLYDKALGAARAVEGMDALPSQHVRAVLESQDGSLWIGTTAGLVRRHPDGSFERVRDLGEHPDGFIRGLSPAHDGGVWIALGNGLMRWHTDERIERWQGGHELPGIGALDVLDLGEDRTYIGGDHGLLRLRDGRFRAYGRDEGAPEDTIFRITHDAQGMLWMCGNRGAYRLDPRALDDVDAGRDQKIAVDVLGRSNGMPSSQCNGGSGPAGDFDASGRLWLPTALGVAVIDPVAVTARSRVRVPLRIESITADGTVLAPAAQHVIAPSVHRVVLRYIGFNLRAPGEVRYRYRLSGFDRDWIDAGNALEAVYTNLPPGELRFEVEAAMAPVDWTSGADFPRAVVSFRSTPPYWRQPWFYALFPILVVALSVLVFAWRAARYRRRQRILTALVETRTRELIDKNDALERADHERESLLRQLAYQARHDALTGLRNRRAGEECLRDALERAEETFSPLCVALLDVDRFKRINDAYGHDAGDTILRHIAALLAAETFPGADKVARYGGEEFLLVMPGLTLEEANGKLAELVARVAAASARLGDGRRIGCTVSIGVARWHPGLSSGQLVLKADRALYRAKDRGRNRVEAGL